LALAAALLLTYSLSRVAAVVVERHTTNTAQAVAARVDLSTPLV
jgi:hypothetical protein